ncbi:hypothetical protein K439DRAFT_1619113 [Ramaria rubella]|nr:hypothetical protein K439DRAFT_1619113 [Ramaria rubella]
MIETHSKSSSPPGTATSVQAPSNRSIETPVQWLPDNLTAFIDFLIDHKVEAGNGLNFKPVIWTKAVKYMINHTSLGGVKTPNACRTKWGHLKDAFAKIAMEQRACRKHVQAHPKSEMYGKHGFIYYEAMAVFLTKEPKGKNVFWASIQQWGQQPLGNNPRPSQDGGHEGDEVYEDFVDLLSPGMDLDSLLAIAPRTHPSTMGPPQTPLKSSPMHMASPQDKDDPPATSAIDSPGLRGDLPHNFQWVSASTSNSSKHQHLALDSLPPGSSAPSEKRAHAATGGVGLNRIGDEFQEFNNILWSRLPSPKKGAAGGPGYAPNVALDALTRPPLTKADCLREAIELAQAHSDYLTPKCMCIQGGWMHTIGPGLQNTSRTWGIPLQRPEGALEL